MTSYIYHLIVYITFENNTTYSPLHEVVAVVLFTRMSYRE